ncbi:signal peptidase I [Nocardioides campestrisoli]|uniref:signal peptidase I n=1 Tax=Nocardioides campestrisoli TaxID=2736757 RepID=UPI00163D42E2|nr:signal peptidase I [Nocardioides campestrisoli]
MSTEDRDPSTHDGDEESRSSASPKTRKPLPLWQETGLLLVVALVLAVAVKTFFVQAFYIPSESMEPGLVNQDRILVQKVSYWGGGEPERGDVVVFKDPGGWLEGAAAEESDNPLVKLMTKVGLYPSGGHLVKRVIGVEGDVIECCDEEGRLLVNGQPMDEDAYVKDDAGTPCNGPMTGTCDWKAGPVPEGHVFVMGDNRGRSADSTRKMCTPDETDCVPGREFVPADLVVGKVFVVLWPWDHFRWVTRPDVFDDVADAAGE